MGPLGQTHLLNTNGFRSVQISKTQIKHHQTLRSLSFLGLTAPGTTSDSTKGWHSPPRERMRLALEVFQMNGC